MHLSIDSSDAGKRLDHLLQQRLAGFSRSRIQEWIKQGRVLVNGSASRPSCLLRAGDQIQVEPASPPPLKAVPEEIPLRILYEDPDVIAVEKPAGMVVHAGAGIHAGTLVNALLHRFGTLSSAGGDLRPGIVHRLDRFTSGVLLVAKHDAAHHRLAEQFARREIEKVYLALVQGNIAEETGKIDKPITRDPQRRVRMTARLETGRSARTSFRVLRRFPGFTFLEVRIGTGRTHQIRVHLSSIGHPVVGDRLYGAAAVIPGHPPLGRYFLHAHRIRFHQPSTGREIHIESPLPPDLEQWMAGL